jgi:hypothetical protein
MRGRIEVGLPRIDGRRVTVPLAVSGAAARRIVRDDFWCEYDFDPHEVPPQILTVPVVASLLPVSWLEDFELSVATLDRTFSEAAPATRAAWGGMYSSLDLGGSFEVVDTVATDVEAVAGRTVSLFSGGLDSMAAALSLSGSDAILCTYWGIDVPPDDVVSWEATWARTERYGELVGASTTFVRTNLRLCLDRRGLNRRHSPPLTTWEDATSHISLLGMAAPVAVRRRASAVHVPATMTSDTPLPYGQHPAIDETVRFGNVRSLQSGYELDRVMKARLVTQRTPDASWLVCRIGTARAGRNCGSCSKCFRTGFDLFVAGADPAAVGLEIDWTRLPAMQRQFKAGRVDPRVGLRYHWWTIQRHLPIPTDCLAPEAEEFLAWLETVDVYNLPMAPPGRLRRIRRLLARLIPHRFLGAARRMYVRVFPRW